MGRLLHPSTSVGSRPMQWASGAPAVFWAGDGNCGVTRERWKKPPPVWHKLGRGGQITASVCFRKVPWKSDVFPGLMWSGDGGGRWRLPIAGLAETSGEPKTAEILIMGIRMGAPPPPMDIRGKRHPSCERGLLAIATMRHPR